MYQVMTAEHAKLDLKKALSTSLLAGGITFSLFVLMDKLTSVDLDYIEPPESYPLFDTVMREPKKNPIIKKVIKPLPEPKMPPASLVKLETLPPDDTGVTGVYKAELPTPVVSQKTLSLFSMGNGEVTPVVRMEPKYPVTAARDGIEGWVKLVFTIDAAGQVKDIQVIEAEPSRIFNREAKRALARWKYKPQLVDGKPSAKTGNQVVLNFRLDS